MSDHITPSLFSPAEGERGMTALHYAAYSGDLASLKSQLASGADPNQRDDYRGYTALHWLADMAAAGGQRLEMLALLIAHGARVDAPATNGTTALALAREAGNAVGDRLVAELQRLGAKE